MQVLYTKIMDTKKLKNTIAMNIRMQRAKKDINQEQLAELIELSTTQLSALERGTSMPKVPTLMKLADVFGVKVDDLLH